MPALAAVSSSKPITRYTGQPVVFGVRAPKPIVGAPDGKQRLRLRNRDFARLFVKTPEGIRHFLLLDDGDNWRVDLRLEQGRNIRK